MTMILETEVGGNIWMVHFIVTFVFHDDDKYNCDSAKLDAQQQIIINNCLIVNFANINDFCFRLYALTDDWYEQKAHW
jgi:hypothetical protein